MTLRKASAVVFLMFVFVYALPAHLWYSILGEPASFVKSIVDYRIIFPVMVLLVSSVWLTPWQMVLGLLFCLLGDWFGAADVFLAQMGFFALGQIMFCLLFRDFIRHDARVTGMRHPILGYVSPAVLVVAALLFLFVVIVIVPKAPGVILKVGVTVYALLIILMGIMAYATTAVLRNPIFAIGATTFLFSDTVLACQKFLWPETNLRLLVVLTYELAVFLLWYSSQMERRHSML